MFYKQQNSKELNKIMHVIVKKDILSDKETNNVHLEEESKNEPN